MTGPAFDAARLLECDLRERVPWLQGVGVGSDGGEDVLYVYGKSRKNVDCPRHWMGYKVILQYVGQVRPA